MTLIDRSAINPLLPSWWKNYECSYLMSVPILSVYTYFSELYLCGGSDDVQLVITSANCEFDVLSAVQFLLYAAEGAVPNYFVGSLLFHHVRCGMVFLLPASLGTVLRHYRFLRLPNGCKLIPYLRLWHFLEQRRLIGSCRRP